MADQDQKPIIIIKKIKKGGGRHHGGAWKVAYADFVTAMMALFIVLWLLSSDEKVKQAVGGYFQDPSGNGRQMGSTMQGSGEGLELKETDMKELKEKIERAMRQKLEFKKISKNVQITVTNEGLRIELIENDKGMFFQSARAIPSENGEELIAMLAGELGRLPNKLTIEGHTDAKPFNSGDGYSNWELSADRANAARRVMMANGIRSDQVNQVRGFADQRLKDANDPANPFNRRISMIVQYLNIPLGSGEGGESKETAAKASHGEAGKTPEPAKKPGY